MGTISVEIKGTQALIRNLDKFANDIENILEEEIAKAATNIYNQATADTPEDFGILKGGNQWQAEGLEAVVKNTIHYAPYVEFGTGGLVDVPEGLEDYAIQFKGQGIRKINLTPRPFLFPAFFDEIPELEKRINDRIKSSINNKF